MNTRTQTLTRYQADKVELRALLADQPTYRVEQVWNGWYSQLLDTDDITTIPKSLRSMLDANMPAALTEVTRSVDATGDTTKFLWRLPDGATIETVLMLYPDRATVCVSTQAGCAMACGFCATGQSGFERHLTRGEIIEQVIAAAMVAASAPEPRRVSNIVFMGMGEPLANFEPVWDAAVRIHDDIGISARHLTISTVGIVPGIRRLAAQTLPVNLAVSLHAANDTLRDELVPINRRYPLAALADACRDYLQVKNRRLSFEWAMIENTNDSDRDADELAKYAKSLRAHINLIPLNPTPGYPTVGTSMRRVRQFRDRLTDLGANATIRANRGTDIDAACGQLRAVSVELAPKPKQTLPE